MSQVLLQFLHGPRATRLVTRLLLLHLQTTAKYETKTKSDSKLTENDYFLRASELGLPRLRSRDHLFAKGLIMQCKLLQVSLLISQFLLRYIGVCLNKHYSLKV